jgi:hypothetical protein
MISRSVLISAIRPAYSDLRHRPNTPSTATQPSTRPHTGLFIAAAVAVVLGER